MYKFIILKQETRRNQFLLEFAKSKSVLNVVKLCLSIVAAHNLQGWVRGETRYVYYLDLEELISGVRLGKICFMLVWNVKSIQANRCRKSIRLSM